MKLRLCRLLVSAPLFLYLGACHGNQGASTSGAAGARNGAQASSPAGAMAPERQAGAAKGPSPAGAATATPAQSDLPAELLRQASVPVEQARAIALSRVPGAALQSEELERENGSLIYSFDLVVPGRTGIDEVNVDAQDASKVVVQHEGPAQEKAEKDAEANPGS